MKLDREQQRVANRIRQVGRQVGASPMEIKSALATGIVESGLRNLPGGDADSSGWRQERASLYKDPTNLEASIRRYFKETRAVRGKYGNAGDLAAAVQRPAAQYRGRYAAVSAQAQKLLGDATPLNSAAPNSRGTAGRVTTTASGPSEVEQRNALLGDYLNQRGRPGALAGLGTGLANVEAPTTTTRRIPGTPGAAASTASAPGAAGDALEWARAKIGNPETGENSGNLAGYANKRFGMSNQPWCAMFTSLATTKGGAPASARTASVAEVRAKAQRGEGYVKGFIAPGRARPGDLITFGNRHIGMVESVSGGKITMIAGNDSDRVNRRTVTVAGDTRIVRPAYGRK